MDFQKLTADVRTGRKKGTARRLRRGGRIPAVCYGPDTTVPVALSVDPKGLAEALAGPLGKNTVLELAVVGEGAPEGALLVMLQDIQYHPVSRSLLHADFLTVARDREVQVDVPLTATGRAVGVQTGGVLTQIYRVVPVRCALDSIPTELTLDVTRLELGDALKVADLQLPAGVRVELEPTQTLVAVTAPTVVAEPTEGEEAAAAEPAEGAPAEGKAEGKKEGE